MRCSHEDSGSETSQTQQQLQIAGFGSPKAPPPSADQHPQAAKTLANRAGGLINGTLAQKQQAYALIISSIFNIHNASLHSVAPQQLWVFPHLRELRKFNPD